ncbi:MAG TPA: ankyrin repeat domain-containing protein [Verrucomicrobiae bacterium]|nr:ankyrin repeat domain-containing protein [Verrucomicrobiae bacterium]
MKSGKIILLIVVLLLVTGIGFGVWKLTDHTAEFTRALYSGNISRVEDLLKNHPSLANCRQIGEPMNNRSGPAKDWTPMHVAAFLGDTNLIHLLATYHVDPNVRDKRGLTPLLWTAFGGKHEAAEALLQAGADVNARGLDGRSTLDLAKLSLDNDLVDVLRQHGAKE